MKFLSTSELLAGLETIRESPKDHGTVLLVVRRPAVNERELLDEAALDCVDGMLGDTWKARRSSHTADGSPHPDMQLTVMNSRAIDLMAQSRDRWPLAGDQLFVDLDLSAANLPPGTRLALGSAVIEVTAEPHTGCGKFVERFGLDAMKFVNSRIGRELQLRGINARVVQSGVVRVGDVVKKTSSSH